MKRLLFFSSEPGGAEVLIPVIHLVQKQEYDVRVLASDHAVARFKKRGIRIREMSGKDRPSLNSIMRDYRPNYLITSAASLPWTDMTEKLFWSEARKAGVGSIAFLDQWQNYSERFSGVHLAERLGFLPDYINCINETGRGEMIEEGFPENKLMMFGHPYLDHIVRDYGVLSPDETISKLGFAAADFYRRETMIFVSEPLYENYGNSRGYNQYDVLSYFLKNVLMHCPQSRVLIKLHPKDIPETYHRILKNFTTLEIHVVGDELSSLECLKISNRIFGMTSLMLIEAFLLGKTVISIQPGLIVADPLVLSRHGLIPGITQFDDLNPLAFESANASEFSVTFDSSGFLRFLTERLHSLPQIHTQKGCC